MPQLCGMRRDVRFGDEGELFVKYYSQRGGSPLESPSASEWLIPGTHPDDPSFRA